MGSAYHGKACNAYWNTAALTQVTGWTATLAVGTGDSTSRHDSNTGRTRIGGIPGGTATVTCILSGDVEIAEGASAVLELLRDATDASKGYKGTATCTGVEIGVDVRGVEVVTYSFQFSGTITGTVTEGTP